jgi:thiol-disulfide isomerase/thioredoxin
MNKIKYLVIVCVIFFNCSGPEPTVFSEESLNDTFITLDQKEVTFKSILEKAEESIILIDVWASWCSDCVGNLPKVEALHQEYQNATYIFLSLDKNQEAWKKGIEKYNIQGQHYFMKSGWKGPFGSFLKLDWIPRYMVVDKQGNIKLYNAIQADDKKIKNLLK